MILRPLILTASLLLPHAVLAAGAEATVSPVITPPEGAPPRPVATLVVTEGADPARATTGTVTAASETDLAFTLPGRLAERRVNPGDLVQAGDVLAVLDPEDVDAALREAEARLAAAQAQLSQARDAETRAAALQGRGVASQVQLDQARQARIGAQSAVEQAQAAQAAAADRQASATLVAPEGGIITQAPAEPGATLAAGQPVVQLASIARREVVIDVTESELAVLGRQSEFRIALLADPGVTATATLGSVDPVAASATRTRRVHLNLPADAPEGLRLGALADVLPISGAAALPMVPVGAVMAGEAPSVWVVIRPEPGGPGTIQRRTITPGPVLNGSLSVSDGLAPGDEVLIRGIHSVTEGESVGPRTDP
ncbi:efflux RND transporter periplasmic adaptor subunit [Paracoccus sp. p4-l81]|uniref:efflux RND transporter periplasmic adaptor subunit n=1 Tax=unclassified Paracoccus (in: a-proteobacteria) TaxID=2688777 RepID=UPI0035B7A4AF